LLQKCRQIVSFSMFMWFFVTFRADFTILDGYEWPECIFKGFEWAIGHFGEFYLKFSSFIADFNSIFVEFVMYLYVKWL
jgi:hypothetical protein